MEDGAGLFSCGPRVGLSARRPRRAYSYSVGASKDLQPGKPGNGGRKMAGAGASLVHLS